MYRLELPVPAVLTPKSTAALILRTVHLDAKLVERLRAEAFDARTPKNDLIRQYVRAGLNLKKAEGGAPP